MSRFQSPDTKRACKRQCLFVISDRQAQVALPVVGQTQIAKGGALGFRGGDSVMAEAHFRTQIMEELRKTFRPEFLNRVDEIVIFHRLTPEHIVQIVSLEAKEVGSG